MTEILVVLCGGTIGSRVSDGEIALTEGGALRVAENYLRTHSGVHFTICEPFCISSEEITDSFYLSFFDYFKSLDLSGYDGVIITHGTDTLSYTAPLFPLHFCGAKIPLVFVSADFVPDDIRSNADRNFSDAVTVIKSGIRGIFSVSDGSVILASRLCEADWLSNSFTSFDGVPIMTVENDEIRINNLDLLKRVSAFDGKGVKIDSFENKILMISPYPGIDYSSFDISGCSAVLHLLYHSGTASSEQLEPFIKKCREQGKDFYVAPVKRGAAYSSTLKMIDCGAIPLCNISREAALAKLKTAYNNSAAESEIINSNIYFELLSDS